MFTGIVQAKGTLASISPHSAGARLLIDPGAFNYRPAPGDSIAVNGVCLTHAPAPGDDNRLAFDVITETLNRTNLGQLQAGSAVNLEASLRADTPIAGHFVQGHVDGIGIVHRVSDYAKDWRLAIRAPLELMSCIVPKGSITIDGVSLTIAATDPRANLFEVALIPTTLDLTTLGDARAGDKVNLETDIIARTIVNFLQHHTQTPGGITIEKLIGAGFAR